MGRVGALDLGYTNLRYSRDQRTGSFPRDDHTRSSKSASPIPPLTQSVASPSRA